MKNKIIVLIVILLCCAMNGCVRTNPLDLTRYHVMEVKMTSEQGIKEVICDKEDIVGLNELLHRLDLKAVSPDIGNGWQISCTLSNEETSLNLSVLDDHIEIGGRCYQIPRDGDRIKLVSYFDHMFKEEK